MANIPMAPGFNHAPLDLTNPDPAGLIELQNALKNMGYWNGQLGAPPDLSLIYAVGAFQRSFGYGGASPTIDANQWYGLLYANDQVVNKRPLDQGVWNSLAGARQMGMPNVIDPNTFSAAPPGAIGVTPGTIQQVNQKPAAPAPATPVAPSQGAQALPDMTDAFGSADAFLNSVGLGAGSEFDLRPWAHQQMTSPTFNADVFSQDLQKTDAYQQRFGKVNADRLAKGLPAMTPGQILQYEQTVGEGLRASGAPSSFYDSWKDFQDPIANGWSPKEVLDRADVVSQWVYNLPPEARQLAGQWFGIGNGDTALWAAAFDPNKALPLLQHQLTMTEIGAAGQKVNIGIDQTTADTLAGMGVTQGQAIQGFGQLDRSRALFDENAGERQDLTLEGTGIGATFGTEGGAQAALDQRLASRRASVQGGGGAEVSSRGVAGLGTGG